MRRLSADSPGAALGPALRTVHRPRAGRFRPSSGTSARARSSSGIIDTSWMQHAHRPSPPPTGSTRTSAQGILTRRYADNDLLAEGAIALEAGVSRTPVREALLRLEAEGMIRLLPKRGALVLPVTAQEWRDVLDTRLLVESTAVAR